MSANIFIDTNIFVYAYVSNEETKCPVARDLLSGRLLDDNIFISTQVMGEFYAVMKKYKRAHSEIVRFLDEIIQDINMADISLPIVRHGLELVDKYGYSYWDSLILSAALASNCEVVYSEDMQNNQVIEGKLKIINPFANQ